MGRRQLISSTLILLILTFTIYFSWYTIRRYQTLNAYTADLSLIDQAMWNTLRGRFLEATWGDRQQPRLAEHFEPILVPLASVFWLWDDVRALLIMQALALAAGALPVYWLARELLSQQGLTNPALHLLFPTIYLLSPPLQAAAVADFHADPLMVAPFLFAFWYAGQKRWGWMWFWAIVVMMTKENMPALVVMLGGYLLFTGRGGKNSAGRIDNRRPTIGHGAGLIVVGLLWFFGATFGLVAPLAEKYFGSDGPIYLANRFSANPLDWPLLLRDPARWRYLGGLIATTGGLALLAPQYLLLALPIFAANTFSNFVGQYSGEQHYSAPLVAVLTIAAIYGARNLAAITRDASRVTFHLLLILAFTITLIYHALFGWTPFSRRAEPYLVSQHTQTLPGLLAQIPDGVPISASAAVHPHLAHRPIAYTFPTVQEAEYILVDVSDVPGVHPNDLKSNLETYLKGDHWHLLEAIDGFILLRKETVATEQPLPDQFFAFARAGPMDPQPQFRLNLTFEEQIRLLGFDVLDEPFHRQTKVRLYWQALQGNLAPDLTLWPQFFDDFGGPLTDPIQQPAIATLWYPPARWQADEIIIAETLPQNLGERFHLAVGVTRGANFAAPGRRLKVSGAVLPYDQATWAHIASFERNNWTLDTRPPQPTFQKLQTIDLSFEGGIRLTGLHLPPQLQAGEPLSILLQWETEAPLPIDYTIFLHLIDAAGNTVAQADAQPFWLSDSPTTRWQPGQAVLDAHSFSPPLPGGTYRLRLGLYDWQTSKRLPLLSGEDAAIIGELQIRD